MILEAVLSSVKAPGKVNQGRSQESGQTKSLMNRITMCQSTSPGTGKPGRPPGARNGQGAPATLVDKS